MVRANRKVLGSIVDQDILETGGIFLFLFIICKMSARFPVLSGTVMKPHLPMMILFTRNIRISCIIL